MDCLTVKAGSQYTSANADNSTVTIVTPADNLYGLIIRTCTMVLSAPANSQAFATLVADTTAPTFPGGRVIAACMCPPGGWLSQIIPYEIYVQPGLGLYWSAMASLAGTDNAAVITYDLVQAGTA